MLCWIEFQFRKQSYTLFFDIQGAHSAHFAQHSAHFAPISNLFLFFKLESCNFLSRTRSVPGHLVPHNWSPRTNGPVSFGTNGQMVPKPIGPHAQTVPAHLVHMDKLSPKFIPGRQHTTTCFQVLPSASNWFLVLPSASKCRQVLPSAF